MNTLEIEILRSMVDYPQFIDKFLSVVSVNNFSKEGNILLGHIINLRDKGILTINTLSNEVDEQTKKSDYFIKFLTTDVNPNYYNTYKIFLKSIQIEKQFALAQTLIKHSENGMLMTIEDIQNDLSTNNIVEYKSMGDWIEYYKDRLEQEKVPTNIEFIDRLFNGGFEIGQLILISGDQESGKTTLGTQIIENMSIHHKVCLFSFEFQVQKYLNIAKDRHINKDNLIIINEGYDISEVAQNIKNLYNSGVKVFLIDSQLRVENNQQTKNTEANETMKFSILAKLCHSLDIIIMFIVQTSKTDPNTPISSKRGGHEASIIIRMERIPLNNKEAKSHYGGGNNDEYDRYNRVFNIQKNKQTGISTKEVVSFNVDTLRYYSKDNIHETTNNEYNNENIGIEFIDLL